MDLRASLTEQPPGETICSAKGCRVGARWALRWNNPSLHDESRRKVWLACDLHEPTLRQFLAARGFHRDTVPVTELEPSDG